MADSATVATATARSAPQGDQVTIVDLPLRSLIPLRKRTAKALIFERLESNIRSVGLIEPLLVHPYKGQHFIIDGYLRYLVLNDLGAQTVPCILIDTLDTYTPNRQVSYLSMSQRWRMLKKALTVVDEERLKSALALKRLRHGFSNSQSIALIPEVQKLVEDDRMSRSAAAYLVHVTQERQREILSMVEVSGDYSAAFIRAQILRTPPEQRILRADGRSPWNRAAEVKKKLADRLLEANRHADFFQGLYRQYARDLTVLAIYARDILTHKDIREYVGKHFPAEMKLFQQIIQQTKDAEVA